MPSFDVVSQVNMAELDNALTQTRKEVETRYDFKGAKATIDRTGPNELLLKASGEERVGTLREMLFQKLAKRGISLRNVELGKLEESGLQTHKQVMTIREGIASDKAKRIVALVKESKIKVQAAIQGDTVRVTGKDRDDLQAVIALLRGQMDALELELQFNNFRE